MELWTLRREPLMKNFGMRERMGFFRGVGRLAFGGRGATWGSQWRWAGGLLLGLTMVAWPVAVRAQNVSFEIPQVKIPLKIKEQTITITASGVVSVHS